MARRPLPRILRSPDTPLALGRDKAYTAAHGALDVLRPLVVLVRGLHRLAVLAVRLWSAAPGQRRSAVLFAAGGLVLTVALVPYGPPVALAALACAAVVLGRGPASRGAAGPEESQVQRLRALYEALVPYFCVPEDPDPLYTHGGAWEKAFASYDFDTEGRLARLVVRYPAYFADGDAMARAGVERVVHAKSGRGREYRFGWDEEGNELTVTVLSPLPAGIAAQRSRAAHETVLGFTDPADSAWSLPVMDDEAACALPPVVWRTGPRCTEPHLLAVGQPGSGTSTLLRSLALQALAHGDVLIVDGSGTGEYAFLKGRAGVLAVESGLTGALAGLEWAANETRRRLVAAGRARQAGRAAPPDVERPLWLLVDRPAMLADLAVADGRPDPLALLQLPLRQGRAARVTVAVAEQCGPAEGLGGLGDGIRQYTRARVLLGQAPPDWIETVLGAPPHTAPAPQTPPGRGYVRLGAGPVLRLQVPATPDPYDDTASAAHRQAVLDLLPLRTPDVAPVPATARPACAAQVSPSAPEPAAVAPDAAAATAATRTATASAPHGDGAGAGRRSGAEAEADDRARPGSRDDAEAAGESGATRPADGPAAPAPVPSPPPVLTPLKATAAEG